MDIEPIAVFRSPLKGKFGVPRQSGLAEHLQGEIHLASPYNRPDSTRGLDGFDYLWLIWGFSLNKVEAGQKLTVRPPRLGGNERVGVFASRSPFRPNGLGLSSVRIERVDSERGVIHVLGADLADGTPIFDIKPYVPYADSHPGARAGFTDTRAWEPLEVVIPEGIAMSLTPSERESLAEVLRQDPRPRYQDDPSREYGLDFGQRNIRFRVQEGKAIVVSV